MLLPTIVRASQRAAEHRRAEDRYAGWMEAVYRLRSDCRPGSPCPLTQLRNYLDGVLPSYHREVLEDLIAEHLRLSWEGGSPHRLELYLEEFGREFPELADPLLVSADLVEDEFLARYSVPWGDAPLPGEYRHRFPGRADVDARLEQRFLCEGRYVRLERLGGGAMGEVFKAYDRQLGRLVAIKQPRRYLLGDTPALARFDHEARLTAALEHPAIVSVHEHYPHEGIPFYVMRLTVGQTLGEQIADWHQPPGERTAGQQRLIQRRLVEVLATVCEAIAYAHAQGIVHGDLKPANVVVGPFGETAIIDWGLARRIPASGEVCPSLACVAGTPQYMPPEQVDGRCDHRSDIFGLGAILYEMITGRPPHHWPEGALPVDWQTRVREAQFVPSLRLNATAPRALHQVCKKALAADPAQRYASAAELAGDVRRTLAGEALASFPATFANRIWRWLRGN